MRLVLSRNMVPTNMNLFISHSHISPVYRLCPFTFCSTPLAPPILMPISPVWALNHLRYYLLHCRIESSSYAHARICALIFLLEPTPQWISPCMCLMNPPLRSRL